VAAREKLVVANDDKPIVLDINVTILFELSSSSQSMYEYWAVSSLLLDALTWLLVQEIR